MLLGLFSLQPGLPQIVTVGLKLCQVSSYKWAVPQVAQGLLP